MSKSLQKSSTVQNAAAAFVITLITVASSSWDAEAQTFRVPNQLEVAALMGAGITLHGTIEGRKKAVEPIKGTPAAEKELAQQDAYAPLTDEELLQMSALTPAEPNYDYVASLPSAFDAPEAVDVNDTETIDIEETGELDVDFSLDGVYSIKIVNDTRLKTSMEDSSTLEPYEQKFVKEGEKFDIEAYKFIGKTDHIEVKIGGSNYYLYVPHIQLFNDVNKEVLLTENSSPIVIVDTKKTPIKLPGYQSTFFLEDSVIPNGNFTWNEVTHGGTRIPSTQQQVDNAITLCRHLQKLREYLGNVPMRITSFGRPEPINSRVGGAKNSFHTRFMACDFYVPGANMYAIQDKVKTFWISNKIGGVGEGVKRGNFVHVDLGPVRVFPYN